MYAVIATGGKQHRVSEGDRIRVERLAAAAGEEVVFTPVLVVSGSTVTAQPSALSTSTVTARVVGEVKGPKINGLTYKSKSNNRRRWGHRQPYSLIEVTKISSRS